MVSYGSLLCSRIHLQREKVKHKAGAGQHKGCPYTEGSCVLDQTGRRT